MSIENDIAELFKNTDRLETRAAKHEDSVADLYRQIADLRERVDELHAAITSLVEQCSTKRT